MIELKKTKLSPESIIQRSIITYLEKQEAKHKLYFFRSNSFTGRVIRQNGTTGFVRNGKKGMPDIIICVGAKFVALEVKALTGIQSVEQKTAEIKIKAAGGEYYVVKSLNEVIKIIESFQVLINR